MDLSSVYVAMCSCEELQDKIPLSSVRLEDFVAIEISNENEYEDNTGKFILGRLSSLSTKVIDDVEEIEDYSIHHPIDEIIDISEYDPDFWFIKLYEQDELQEMIMDSLQYSLFRMFVEFNHFYMKDISDKGLTLVYDTYEKVWMGFYMKVMYKKVWNGKWEKI
jgi:hypothetical protein